jgi:hypothetical protein
MLKHGLSARILRSTETATRVATLAAAIYRDHNGAMAAHQAHAFAEADATLNAAMKVRAGHAAQLLTDVSNTRNLALLDEINRLDRYERRASSKANKALRKLARQIEIAKNRLI